jgi:hypothetical protein
VTRSEADISQHQQEPCGGTRGRALPPASLSNLQTSSYLECFPAPCILTNPLPMTAPSAPHARAPMPTQNGDTHRDMVKDTTWKSFLARVVVQEKSRAGDARWESDLGDAGECCVSGKPCCRPEAVMETSSDAVHRRD